MLTDTVCSGIDSFSASERKKETATLGMWVFLATEVLFFGVLFGGYLLIRLVHSEAFAIASQRTDLALGSINTAVLLTSSLSMALAVRASSLGVRRGAAGWLLVTLLLGLLFLGIKGIEYHKDFAEGLVPVLRFEYSGPHRQGVALFFFLYFVMTGLHALHLIIAIGVVGAIAVRTVRGRFSDSYYTPVEMAGLYWHFVDIVWIFLYPLLYLVSRA